VVMVHPDSQYTPKLIPAMASMIAADLYRVYGQPNSGATPCRRNAALEVYRQSRPDPGRKYFAGGEAFRYHTGYRAFSRELLERLPLSENSDDFVFDNQMLAQILWFGYTIAEVSCPTRYFTEASSINFGGA